VAVDEAIALWERGEKLYALCRERLDAAEGRVDELAKRVQPPDASA
jgi:exodeoxyribonuclease VII small subunit